MKNSFALCTREWVEVEGVAGYKFTGPQRKLYLYACRQVRAHRALLPVLVWKAAIFPVPSMFLILSLP
ncbi:MAG: hypothetical protein ACLUE2_18160 [Bacteroides cellulosilyticus]